MLYYLKVRPNDRSTDAQHLMDHFAHEGSEQSEQEIGWAATVGE